MKKLLIALFMTAIMAVGVSAQYAGVDYIEVPVTNYFASVVTNAATYGTAVLPALGTGQGLYSYIKIAPVSGTNYVGLGTTNGITSKTTITGTNQFLWTLPAGGVNGGPYRNTAIYLMNASGSNDTNSVSVEAWKVLKQR